MSFRRISEAEMAGKGNLGRADTPGVSAGEMQRILDELPREVLAPALNELAGQLEAPAAAGLLGAAVPEGLPESTPKTVQGVLEAVRGLAGAHAARTDNPHGVTAAQTGAYTRQETDAAIGQKVVEIGAGDMAQAVYDPTGRQTDIFAELDELQQADAGLSARVTGLELGGASQNVAGYVGEITWFADNILRKNHVWADGSAVDAAQWPELAEYAASADWAQNEAGQYLTPDLRGRFLLGSGASHAVGSVGGSETVTLTVDEMPSHNHDKIFVKSISQGNIGAAAGNDAAPGTGRRDITFNNVSDLYTSYTGGSQPHNNMPPYYAANAQIRAKVDTIQAHLSVCPYEVGDILQTKSETPPSERWPGTEWAAIETFLLGASASRAVGSTGGEETHKLTVDEMPEHTHSLKRIGGLLGPGDWERSSSAGTGVNGYIGSTGGSQPHNNMPPYTAVYIWERTA